MSCIFDQVALTLKVEIPLLLEPLGGRLRLDQLFLHHLDLSVRRC